MNRSFVHARPPTIARLVILALIVIAVTLAGCDEKKEPLPTVHVIVATRTPKPTFTLVPTSTTAPTLAPTATATELPEPSEATATAFATTFATPAAPAGPTAIAVPTAGPDSTASPDTSLNPLTGQAVSDPAMMNRRVLAVRVGNDPSIRPQEGLGRADMVFEEIMEGWTLTRFTALYLADDIERIRPIRSARLSNLTLAPQYDAALVHSGASDQIRWLISQASFVDLDQYFHPDPYGVLEGYDWRGRMYTSVAAVHDYLRVKGLERDARIKGHVFDPTAPQGQPASAIHIPYPEQCVVDWAYAKGAYLRSVKGEPHLEALTGEQIAAENVIVLYAEHKKTDIVEDSNGATAIDIVITGSGSAKILRDGVVIDAAWRMEKPTEPIVYYDANGQVVPLKPGKTWVQFVPTDYDVTVQ